jgi:periplasmic copper chaperone A
MTDRRADQARSTRPGRAQAGALAAAVLVVALAGPAAAHVTANPDEADGPFVRTALRVSHGCEGSPTTAVRVQIPEGVEQPRPEVVPGWDIEIVGAEAGGDEGATGSVAEVAWVAGSLPDEHFQEFGLSFRITDDAPAVLWFPTIQECEAGEHRWIDIPASVEEWGDLEEPAPYVRVAFGERAQPDDGAAVALAVVALGAGLVGLGAGVGAFLRAGRRT